MACGTMTRVMFQELLPPEQMRLRRLKLEHAQLLRLGARAQRQHLDADDASLFIEVQDHSGLDFLRLENRGVG